jgi:UDP-N-acetylmuramyl-tripeptide synthetase
MEISSHALDQHRVAGLHLDAAVWTCLGSDHLDYHKTIERYTAAKRRIFSYLRSDGRAVINADDDEGRRLMEDLVPATIGRDQLVTFGMERSAMVSARLIRGDWSGMDLVMETAWGTFPLRSQLVGRYNISNIAAAVAAALSMGVRIESIQQALAEFPNVPGRFERVSNDLGVYAMVDFAHTADALRLVLLSLRELVRGRLIVVFGCGGDRDQTKRPVMGQLASLLADHVVLTSDNPRSEDPIAIIQRIKSGFVPGFSSFSVMPDRRQAILHALSMAAADDAVLIAGKGHEAYQIFQHVTVPFSDRAVVEEYFTHTAHAVA